MVGKYGSKNKTRRDHTFNHTEKVESQSEWVKAINSQRQPLVTYFLQQGYTSEGPITSPVQNHDWGPSVKIPEPLGSIFIPNARVA